MPLDTRIPMSFENNVLSSMQSVDNARVNQRKNALAMESMSPANLAAQKQKQSQADNIAAQKQVIEFVKSNAGLLTPENKTQAAQHLYDTFGEAAKPFADDIANADEARIKHIQDWANPPKQFGNTGQTDPNLTAAKIRLLDAQAKAAGARAAGNQPTVDASGAVIPPKPSKPPTQDQSNAATYGARADVADKILETIGDKYSPIGVSAQNTMGSMANWALSPETQQAAQAQRDFITAVLRKESGATIGDSEFANARQQYFPQAGDTPAVIAQKKQNRAIAIQGLQNAAGSAAFAPNVDQNVMGSQQSRPMSPQDAQAMQWAQMNPNDPRAQAIFQRLQGAR